MIEKKEKRVYVLTQGDLIARMRLTRISKEVYGKVQVW